MIRAPSLATFLLAVVAALHVARILFGIQVTVADTILPMWASAVVAVVAGGIAFLLWRERREK